MTVEAVNCKDHLSFARPLFCSFQYPAPSHRLRGRLRAVAMVLIFMMVYEWKGINILIFCRDRILPTITIIKQASDECHIQRDRFGNASKKSDSSALPS